MKINCNKCDIEYEEKHSWHFDPGHLYPEREDGKPFGICGKCLNNEIIKLRIEKSERKIKYLSLEIEKKEHHNCICNEYFLKKEKRNLEGLNGGFLRTGGIICINVAKQLLFTCPIHGDIYSEGM